MGPGNEARKQLDCYRQDLGLASFPGLPRSFCSSVCVDNNTRMQKSGEGSIFLRGTAVQVYIV